MILNRVKKDIPKPKHWLMENNAIFGKNKVGKSGLMAQLCAELGTDKALYVNTETESAVDKVGVEFAHIFIDTWKDMESLKKELLAGNHSYKLVVFDSGSSIYKMISNAVCNKKGVKYIDEISYGKGVSEAKAIFQKYFCDLFASKGFGCFFIVHEALGEPGLDDKDQAKVFSVGDTSKKYPLNKWLYDVLDSVIYYDERQKLQYRGDLKSYCGTRWEIKSQYTDPNPSDMMGNFVFKLVENKEDGKVNS